MIGRVNTGGGTGATLTVTAPAGCTVTVSKDGKTKTKTAGADGTAVFNGLSTGTWTVTITDGEQTAQKTVTVTADYATSITLFTATINVTYPAGSTCTVTDGVTTLAAPDTSGTWACVVPNAGTWKISVAGYAPEKSVSITHSGQIVNVVYYTLYSLGDTNTGIDAIGWIYEAGQIPLAPTVAHNNDGLTITLGGYSDGGYNGVAYFPKINLTGFRTISVDISTNNVNTSFGDAYIIGVWSKVGSGYYPSTAAAKKNITNGTKTITLDVTSLNGDYYIGFGIRKDAPTSVYKITRVQLS